MRLCTLPGAFMRCRSKAYSLGVRAIVCPARRTSLGFVVQVEVPHRQIPRFRLEIAAPAQQCLDARQ